VRQFSRCLPFLASASLTPRATRSASPERVATKKAAGAKAHRKEREQEWKERKHGSGADAKQGNEKTSAARGAQAG